jgi:hypothetical protein
MRVDEWREVNASLANKLINYLNKEWRSTVDDVHEHASDDEIINMLKMSENDAYHAIDNLMINKSRRRKTLLSGFYL